MGKGESGPGVEGKIGSIGSGEGTPPDVVNPTKDKYGKDVLEEKYFRIIDSKTKKADPSIFFEVTDLKMTAEPGEKAQFLISTAAEDVKVYYEIEKRNGKRVLRFAYWHGIELIEQ